MISIRGKPPDEGGAMPHHARPMSQADRHPGRLQPRDARLQEFGNAGLLTRVVRPRTWSDEDILDRVSRVVDDADTAWTLSGAARVAGVHPSTLIKRFGSREGLLLALSRRWVEAVPTGLPDDPHAELLAWIASLSVGGFTSAKVLARIDMLAEDLRNQELRDLLSLGWQRQLDYLAALVEATVADGTYVWSTPPRLVAQLLTDTACGALLRAAVAPDPTDADPSTAVRDLMEALR